MLSHFSHVWLFVTLWTVACQAPLSMGFSRQADWSGFPLPSPGIEPAPLVSPASAGGFFTASGTWEAPFTYRIFFVWMCSVGNITPYNTAKRTRSWYGMGRLRTRHIMVPGGGPLQRLCIISSLAFSLPLLPYFMLLCKLLSPEAGSFSSNVHHFLSFQLLAGLWAAVKALPAGLASFLLPP